ncbi:alkaline phosphatase family protein [Chitinophaga silvatica]|uniref:Alkaline phosphatase family protein n=1 Tax=Chitinophaga silvatica TaxID=2282649 RepID=A0A3E1Y7M8_9BACT|nr:ectonucleotide pyrophosphatase/phosphodiesterase [Chitinophaga silvatica]RFS21074.1 alkaline phosphatase family protein [Chitinophaga silvatica]
MKKWISISLSLLVGFFAQAQLPKHVVLITIDGFRPDFYKDAGWGMVNLRWMKENGAYAEGVNSVFPSVTYPNHTSLITGVRPGKHGVYNNTPFEENGQTGKWFFYYDSIKVPTLFDAVKKAGKTSANVIWPVSVNAPIDYNIPDMWEVGVKDRRALMKRICSPVTLWDEVVANATGQLNWQDFTMEGNELILDENVARMAAYLIKTYKPTFTTLHLPCVDHFEHEEGRDGLMVRKAVSGADRALGTIIESLKRAGIFDSTAIIITGDHGFIDVNTTFSPNVLLAQAGLFHTMKDWKARFHSSLGSTFLYLKDTSDKETLNSVVSILKKLPAAQQKMFRILDRDKLNAVNTNTYAVLALAATPGIIIDDATSGQVVRPAKGGTHGQFPDTKEIQTGFVAYGVGISKGGYVKEMGVIDVAPIIAKLLGLSFEQVEGKVPPGIIK